MTAAPPLRSLQGWDHKSLLSRPSVHSVPRELAPCVGCSFLSPLKLEVLDANCSCHSRLAQPDAGAAGSGGGSSLPVPAAHHYRASRACVRGPIQQVPPPISAKKVGGTPAYKLANPAAGDRGRDVRAIRGAHVRAVLPLRDDDAPRLCRDRDLYGGTGGRDHGHHRGRATYHGLLPAPTARVPSTEQ